MLRDTATAADRRRIHRRPDWKVARTLRDGTPITIRPIQPEDREELRLSSSEFRRDPLPALPRRGR